VLSNQYRSRVLMPCLRAIRLYPFISPRIARGGVTSSRTGCHTVVGRHAAQGPADVADLGAERSPEQPLAAKICGV
jgi:hypothetical protein